MNTFTLLTILNFDLLYVLFIVGLFAFIIDGIKLLIESNSKITKRFGENRKEDVTILLSVYNETNILETIETFKKQATNFIIINDNSDDNTLNKICSLGEVVSRNKFENETIYELVDGDYKFMIIDNKINKNKVPSIHFGLNYVKTKFVFICDADIYLSDDFEMPVTLLDNDEIDSVSFNVLPKKNNKRRSIWSNILVGLQLHEYHKSMNIGRQYANNSKSVECISGAAGLFKTERLKKQSKYHSNEFSGEDLERTLIDLFDMGKTCFVDKIIYTDVPENFIDLVKQRIVGWWPGLYRTFPLIFNVFRKKGVENRLRFEMFYNIISTILEPFKFISFWILLFTVNLPILISLYLIYFIFELYMFFRIKKRTNYKIKYSPLQIFLYPIYGIVQLHFKIISMIRTIYMLLRKKIKPLKYMELKSLVLLIGLSLSFFPSIVKSEEKEDVEEKDKWNITLQHSQYDLKGEWESNNLIYVGYDKWYVQYHHGLFNQVNVGAYIGNFLFDLGYRKNTLSAYTLYEQWYGNQTLRGQIRYNYNYGSNIDSNIYPNTPIVGVGFGSYHENTKLTVDVLKELDREYSWILTSRLTQNITNRFAFQTGFMVNDMLHYSTLIKLQYSVVYVFGTYHNNFDYTGLDYVEFGVGLNFRF